MTKRAIAETIQNETGVTAVRAKAAAEAIIQHIYRTLKKDGRFQLPGVGTFTVKKTRAHRGINPRTKEEVRVKARGVVHFKASPKLRKIV
jgi:DNA-binding protein HU-beta